MMIMVPTFSPLSWLLLPSLPKSLLYVQGEHLVPFVFSHRPRCSATVISSNAGFWVLRKCSWGSFCDGFKESALDLPHFLVRPVVSRKGTSQRESFRGNLVFTMLDISNCTQFINKDISYTCMTRCPEEWQLQSWLIQVQVCHQESKSFSSFCFVPPQSMDSELRASSTGNTSRQNKSPRKRKLPLSLHLS